MKNIRDILIPIQERINQEIEIKEKWLRQGFAIIPNSFLLDKRISANAKVLFAVLIVHTFNKNEFCYPSYDLLSEELDWSKGTISRTMGELEEIGLVKIKRTGRSNIVEINFSALDLRVDSVIAHLRKARKKLKL